MEALKDQIAKAFADVPCPGDLNLRNSHEGDEPFLLEDEFLGKDDWTTLSPEFIDQAPDGFSSALSFFSKEAFRFYLPAYLIADIQGQLISSDPVFHLVHGLTDATKGVRINPARYGSLTWFEYVSDRFSTFTPEEAGVIISYLKFKLEQAETDFERDRITQALRNYWQDASFLPV